MAMWVASQLQPTRAKACGGDRSQVVRWTDSAEFQKAKVSEKELVGSQR